MEEQSAVGRIVKLEGFKPGTKESGSNAWLEFSFSLNFAVSGPVR